MERTRVVITGIGAITAIGNDAETFWQALVAGTNGIGPITLFDASKHSVRIAGEVKNFEPTDVMDYKTARRSHRLSHLAVKAARESLNSAKIELNDELAREIGCIMGTSGGVFDMGNQELVIETRGPNRVDPLIIPKLGPHMASGRIGRELGLRGPNSSIGSACASGTDALGHAWAMLRNGDAEIMLAGGTDAMIHPVTVGTMALMGALGKDYNDTPEKASRPFDLHRDGFVLGEGAAVLVLETLEHAQSRGATIMAEYIGHGWSFDALDDAAPDAEGQSLSMARALKSAQIAPDEVSWINAHGTGTPYNDRTETKAIKMAFGEAAAYKIPASSIKSMIGHSTAAAGAIEAVASVLAIRDNKIPPTINLDTPDPQCDLDYVPHVARDAKVDTVLSNSYGMGGQNSTLVFRRFS